MPIADKEIEIEAPVEDVFNYVKEPGNLMQIWPGFIEMKQEKTFPNGGYTFRWKYKMAGFHFTGKGECFDIAPNLWLRSRTTGAIESTATWTFRSTGSKTRVTLTVEYRIPMPLLNRLVESKIVKMNEKEAELILTNLRTRYEARDKNK